MNRAALTLAFVLLASPAFATDFTAPLTNLDGTPIKAPLVQGGKPVVLTLGLVAVTALESPPAPPARLTGPDKVKRFELALKINGKKDVHLTAEETTLLKQVIGDTDPPLIVGRAYQLLDPNSVKEPSAPEHK